MILKEMEKTMSIETRVLGYYKTSSQLCLDNVISRSKNGKCVTFYASTKNKKSIGTLRAINLIEQNGNWQSQSDAKKTSYQQQVSLLCEQMKQSLNAITQLSPTQQTFLSPIMLSQDYLQTEVQKLETLTYLFPKITYVFYDWKETDKFGTDLYVYQEESSTMEFVQSNTYESQSAKSQVVSQAASTVPSKTATLQQNISQTNALQTTASMNTVVSQANNKKTSGYLMAQTINSNDVFGKDIAKSSVKQIVFSDTLQNLPSDAWDVSQQKNRSILAWIRNGVLHICGDGTVMANPNSNYLFKDYTSLTDIQFGNCFSTQNVTNMSGMFWGCISLKQLDLSGFNTNNVSSMGYMFYKCNTLASLDLHNFSTKNVTTMGSMFSNCSSLTKLSLNNFDTKNVINMDAMFYLCKKLTKLDIRSFNTSKVTDLGFMFSYCSSLTQLDLSHFQTERVRLLNHMFDGCTSLKTVDLSSFNTSNVTAMHNMFGNCSSLTKLDLSNFVTKKTTNTRNMFKGCSFSIQTNNGLKPPIVS